jgi:hypothetical protein
MDKLTELLNEIADAECELEEANESGELETRLELALKIDDLKAEHLRESLRETGAFVRADRKENLNFTEPSAPASVPCRHCGRSIILINGVWVDPEATGDDSVWCEVCDEHDTFAAEHEPVEQAQS